MRRTLPLFIAVDDRDFLWQWAAELQQRTEAEEPRVAPHHFIAALIEQLRGIKAQGRLFDELSELEHAALRLARQQEEEVAAEMASRREATEARDEAIARREDQKKESHRTVRQRIKDRLAMRWEMHKKVEQMEQELREKERGRSEGRVPRP